ncbi:MAG: glycosyltransferase family 9 protein [Bacteroidota bacterium]|nr:glycosyltransferase family 9 protein [Bacteroidota bacterium]
MSTWQDCKRILCIRPDNIGDLLMSSPAIAALKETFGAHITLLTSTMAKGIAPYLPAVDEILTWDVPWVKGTSMTTERDFHRIVETLEKKNFDAAVIFTVFSQSALPTALMATLARIPRRLAYCRENPYHLLSHWIPEKEPYSFVRHQVRRDLDLVATVGARTQDERLRLQVKVYPQESVRKKLLAAGVDISMPWVIIHPGASEKKRQYAAPLWIRAGTKITRELGYQVIVTGTERERVTAENIAGGIGAGSFSVAGKLSLEELITLIRFSPLLITVNTGPAHIAAAVETKVIVLYALTNPQHAPWKTVGKVLPFSVAEGLESQNEILRFVHMKYYSRGRLMVEPDDIVVAAEDILVRKNEGVIDELVLPARTGALTE